MNFIAMDFETANGKRTSACSLGIAVVRNLQIVETKHWLIRPEPFEFNYLNVLVHGLTETVLRDKPLFSECWNEIRPYLDNEMIVAHNTSFDISVLSQTLEHYDLPIPVLDYICSRQASQKVFDNVINYRLDTIADCLGIRFMHHNALEDATTAAKILIHMLRKYKCRNITELTAAIGLRPGKLTASNHITCSHIRPPQSRSRKAKSVPLSKRITPTTTKFDEDNKLYAKIVAFTGALNGMGRAQAYQIVADMGGQPADNVTLKTDYLVLGIQDYRLLKDHRQSAKTRKAIEYAKRGTGIQIISEEDFYEMIGGPRYVPGHTKDHW